MKIFYDSKIYHFNCLKLIVGVDADIFNKNIGAH